MEMASTVEWAMHCAFLLARIPDGAPLSGRRLAEFYDLPAPYLSKVLKQLVAADVLTASTGPQGGYRLARPADRITALQIVQAVEGGTPAFRCNEIRQRGPVGLSPSQCRQACGINATMQRAEQAWRDSLQAVTLQELVDGVGAGTNRRVTTWLATR